MALPPILRRFLVEDYQDAPPWFGRFIQVLNSFMEQTVSLFDRNISFGDNIQARSFSTSFITPAGYAAGDFNPVSFTWGYRSLPQLVLIRSIRRDDGSPILASVGVPTWTYTNGSIVVSYIPGLTAGVKYQLALLAL